MPKQGLLRQSMKERGTIFMYLVIIIASLFVGMSYKLFNQKIEEAKQPRDLTGKLDGYRAAFIMQVALGEGPSLFAIIGYF